MEELLSQSERFEQLSSKLGKAIAQAKAHLQQIERTLDEDQEDTERYETVMVRKSLVMNAQRFLN